MRALVLLLSLALTACAGQPPETRYYLLRSAADTDTRQLQLDTRTALGRVAVADYLDQPGIVMATGAGQVTAANFHQWAEPLRTSVRSFLAAEISARLGRDILPQAGRDGAATVIDIDLEQLHGDGDGGASLVARWSIRRNNAAMGWQYSATEPLADDGYDALTAAMSGLLRQLAAAIASAIDAPATDV